MTRANAAVSIDFLRGDRVLGEKRRFNRVNMDDLTPEQEERVREMARETGHTFQECAARVLANQKTLEEY